MKAEEFYKLRSSGRRIENEFFIAMDRASFFKMMEAYAIFKSRIININSAINIAAKQKLAKLKEN